MTIADIIARLFSAKGVTPERITKAQGMAIREKKEWPAVLAAMTAEQRKAVEDAQVS